MFWCVFCYPTQVGFEDMVTVKERHLAVRFDPNLGLAFNQVKWMDNGGTDLVLGILSQIIQGSDVQLEFAGLAEFTKACS